MVGAIPDCQIAGSTSLTLKWPFLLRLLLLLPSLEPDQFGKNDTETDDDDDDDLVLLDCGHVVL